jgi:hypothetical protein
MSDAAIEQVDPPVEATEEPAVEEVAPVEAARIFIN